MEEKVVIVIPAEGQKMRLEDFLLDRFSGLSKMYLREIVNTEKCEVNGRWENRGHRLKENDLIEVTVDQTRVTAMQPADIPLEIVYEDDDLIVVNKPAGMLVHPSHRENNETMLNALSFYLNQHSDKLIRPGLPHRLDKLTSGLVVVAKTALAHRRISNEFLKKRVEKRYLALVDGIVEKDEGTIEAPIGRFADIKQWSVKEDGKHSESRYWVRERFVDTTLIEMEPVTGRTNQLRIHCELIGHPIVGDTQRRGRDYPRLCLHAFRLAFAHPVTREALKFEAPIDFTKAIS